MFCRVIRNLIDTSYNENRRSFDSEKKKKKNDPSLSRQSSTWANQNGHGSLVGREWRIVRKNECEYVFLNPRNRSNSSSLFFVSLT